MFERYTDPCRRAVFFARQTALLRKAAAIDSDHLLLGLLVELRSRAGDIFQLRELLPEDAARQDVVAKQSYIRNVDIPLSDDGKRVLAYTAQEADRLRDYSIDTEHLVLGMLRDENTVAAAKLQQVGLELESCRQRFLDHKGSRQLRPDLLMWWARRFPPSAILPVILPSVFVLAIIVALYLLGFGRR
jgi:ATP-dependent Clp protease ATP-binding subunit ClpC